MKRVVAIAGVLLVFALCPRGELSAQLLWQAGVPGDDYASVNLHFGAILPTTTLPDGSTHETGPIAGASATWWMIRNLGLRGHVSRGQTDGVHGERFSAAAFYADRVWLYSAELVARFPIMEDRLVPYASAGPGGKSWRWSVDRPYPGHTSFAMTGAAGVDFRPLQLNPFGLVLEGRYHRSTYYWHGLAYRDPVPSYKWNAPTINDFVLSAGFSVNR